MFSNIYQKQQIHHIYNYDCCLKEIFKGNNKLNPDLQFYHLEFNVISSINTKLTLKRILSIPNQGPINIIVNPLYFSFIIMLLIHPIHLQLFQL